MCNRDIHKPFMIKEKKRKSRKDSKKEKEKVGNKREGRKITEIKRKIKRGKKESFE